MELSCTKTKKNFISRDMEHPKKLLILQEENLGARKIKKDHS